MTGDWGPVDRLVGQAEALAGAWGARARASTSVGQERAILRLFTAQTTLSYALLLQGFILLLPH